MIDRTKTLSGPCNVSFKDNVPAEIFGVTGLKHGVLTLNVEEQEWENELEDGSVEGGEQGVKLTAEFVTSEIDLTDLVTAKDATIVTLEFEFTAKSKTASITKAAGDRVIVGMEGNKAKLKAVVSLPVGSELDDIITIA